MIGLIFAIALATYAFVRSWQTWRDGKSVACSIAFMLIGAFETLIIVLALKELL